VQDYYVRIKEMAGGKEKVTIARRNKKQERLFKTFEVFFGRRKEAPLTCREQGLEPK